MNKVYLRVLFVVLFYITFISGEKTHAEELVVRYPKAESPNDIRYAYPKTLLGLALSKTADKYGPYSIKTVDHVANKFRLGRFLKAGEYIDILWHAENGYLDDDFITIRIPLLKGIIGYRVLLIRKSDQATFAGIKTIDEFKKLTAGFEQSWADSRILEANGIPLDLAPRYELIFKKLSFGRFDYFPRGINEAWSEVEARKHLYPNITVEDNLMLYYQLPIYFILNKRNHRLAKRVEEGLMISIKDGSFDKLFYRTFENDIEKIEKSNRILFKLHNPFIPPETPKEKQFWYIPNL